METTLYQWLMENPYGNIHGLWLGVQFAVYADGQGQLWLIRRPTTGPGNQDMHMVTLEVLRGDPLMTKPGTV